jgi:Tol biopolymer transport system component
MKRFGILMFAVSLLALGVLSGIDTPAAYADFKFGEAVNLGPTVNSVDADYGAYLSPDGLELYFSSNRGGGYGNTDIWVSTRASVQYPWGTPVNLGPEINTGALDQLGSISADGLVLYFDSGFGLITATRATTDAPWGSRALVRFPPGSTRYADANPVISADGLELFFSSCLDNKYLWQLWVTTRATTSDPWGTPVNLHPGAAGILPLHGYLLMA